MSTVSTEIVDMLVDGVGWLQQWVRCVAAMMREGPVCEDCSVNAKRDLDASADDT